MSNKNNIKKLMLPYGILKNDLKRSSTLNRNGGTPEIINLYDVLEEGLSRGYWSAENSTISPISIGNSVYTTTSSAIQALSDDKHQRLTDLERDALTPEEGTTIYNTDSSELQYYNGTEWRRFQNQSVLFSIPSLVAWYLNEQGNQPSTVNGQIVDAKEGQSRPQKLGRVYNFDGVIDHLLFPHLTGIETVVSYYGTSTPTISAGRIDFTAGTIKDLLLSDGTFLKCEEESGIISFDSSGNGNHGSIVTGDINVFHSTDVGVLKSWSNDIGYTENLGTVIPRNELDTAKDVLGNDLQYTGRVKYNIDVVESPCGNFDGINDKLSFTDLTGITIISSEGTSIPSINGNDINFTAGTCWNLVLSDGTNLTFTEKMGLIIYDVSENNNHGTLTTSDVDAFWSQTQDSYHYALKNGFNKVKFVDGTTDQITVDNSESWLENIGDYFEIVFDCRSVDFHVLGWAINSAGNTGVYIRGTNGVHSIYIQGTNCFASPKFTNLIDLRSQRLTRTGTTEITCSYVFQDGSTEEYAITTPNFSGITFDVIHDLFGTRPKDMALIKIDNNGTVYNPQNGYTGMTFGAGVRELIAPIKINETYTNPASNWNYPPSKLKATATPAFLKKFVHGGTFDGTHYLTFNSTINLTGAFDIHAFVKHNFNTGQYVIAGDTPDGTSNKKISILNGSYFVRVVSSIDNSVSAGTVGIVRKIKLSRDESNIVTLTVDGIVHTLFSGVAQIGTMTINGISELNNNFNGCLSGIKIFDKGVLVAEEPLNGTLNNTTLAGLESTFWVEEYNNLLFDASGTPVSHNPESIEGNYLGLNTMFSSIQSTAISDIIIFNQPQTGNNLNNILTYTNQ